MKYSPLSTHLILKIKSPGICPRDSQDWFMTCHKAQSSWFLTGEVKWLPLAKGQEVRLGEGGPGRVLEKRALFTWWKGRWRRYLSLLSVRAGKGTGHFPSFWEVKSLYMERVLLCFPFLLACLLGKSPLPQNGSLITDAHSTTNMYFSDERQPPWSVPIRLPGEQEVRHGEKCLACWEQTGLGSSPHFLSPQMCGLGESTVPFWLFVF